MLQMQAGQFYIELTRAVAILRADNHKALTFLTSTGEQLTVTTRGQRDGSRRWLILADHDRQVVFSADNLADTIDEAAHLAEGIHIWYPRGVYGGYVDTEPAATEHRAAELAELRQRKLDTIAAADEDTEAFLLRCFAH